MIGRILRARFRHFEQAADHFLGKEPADVTTALAKAGDCTRWSRRQWQDFWGDWRAEVVPQVQQAQLMSVVPASFFQTPDWMGFAHELRGIQEFIRWTLYAYKVYPAAGVVTLLLFDQNEGMALAGRLDTNMMDTGKLPANEMFVGISIGVDPVPNQADVFAVNAANGLAAQQWYNVLTLGRLIIRISGKEYLVIAPLTRVPPGHGFGTVFTSGIVAANQMNIGHLGNGTPDTKAKYSLDPPMGLLPGRPFEARLEWNAVQVVTTAGRIGVGSDGWKVRAVL